MAYRHRIHIVIQTKILQKGLGTIDE